MTDGRDRASLGAEAGGSEVLPGVANLAVAAKHGNADCGPQSSFWSFWLSKLLPFTTEA